MNLSRMALEVPQRKGEFSAWKTLAKQQVTRLNNSSNKIKFNKPRMPNEVFCLPFITLVEPFFSPFLPSHAFRIIGFGSAYFLCGWSPHIINKTKQNKNNLPLTPKSSIKNQMGPVFTKIGPKNVEISHVPK